jgi:hypothetical protein
MNYVADRSCMGSYAEITCGQIERMYQQWYLYRHKHNNNACAASDPTTPHHLEIFMVFDKIHHTEDTWALVKIQPNDDGTTTTTIIFDSKSDFADFEVPRRQDELYMDLCIEPGTYNFVLNDAGQNGFSTSDAYLDVTLDGVLIQTVTGNFGSQVTIPIVAGSVATQAPVPITPSPVPPPPPPPVTTTTTAPVTATPEKMTVTPIPAPILVRTNGPTSGSIPDSTTTTNSPSLIPLASPTAKPWWQWPSTKPPTATPTLAPTSVAPSTATPTGTPTQYPRVWNIVSSSTQNEPADDVTTSSSVSLPRSFLALSGVVPTTLMGWIIVTECLFA